MKIISTKCSISFHITASTTFSFWSRNDGNGITDYEDDSGNDFTRFEYGSMKDVFKFRFFSKDFDAETGLYYYGYRYYNSAIGRWISRDPLGEYGGIQLYGFLANDSINMVDTLGMFKSGPDPLGHNDFSNFPKCPFDFNAEDEDPDTRPLPGWFPGEGWWTGKSRFGGADPERHFRSRSQSESDLNAALKRCQLFQFQRAMHRGQDSFSHYDKGFRWNPGDWSLWDKWFGLGHGLSNADSDIKAWNAAEAWTKVWIDKWKTNCCIPCGYKCPTWRHRSVGPCDPIQPF